MCLYQDTPFSATSLPAFRAPPSYMELPTGGWKQDFLEISTRSVVQFEKRRMLQEATGSGLPDTTPGRCQPN